VRVAVVVDIILSSNWEAVVEMIILFLGREMRGLLLLLGGKRGNGRGRGERERDRDRDGGGEPQGHGSAGSGG
jgi:hypothetical protein